MCSRLICAPVLVALLVATGCGDDTTPAPTTETPTQISETFSGTVGVNGAFSHPFTVTRAGSVAVQVTALSPDGTATVGLALGTWNANNSCQVVIAKDSATVSSSVLGTATAPGTLCIRVYDVGGFTGATNYDVKVDHY
jgi:ABC-type amino acid transport substrate-binding protein